MPYYRIIIWTKKRREPFRGIRLIEIWNPDTAYRIVEEKARNHFGSAAITTRGIKEKHIPKIVNLIDKVLMNHDNEKVITEVRKEVNKLMKDFPLFA